LQIYVYIYLHAFCLSAISGRALPLPEIAERKNACKYIHRSVRGGGCATEEEEEEKEEEAKQSFILLFLLEREFRRENKGRVSEASNLFQKSLLLGEKNSSIPSDLSLPKSLFLPKISLRKKVSMRRGTRRMTYSKGERVERVERVIVSRNSHNSNTQNNSRLLRRKKAGLNSISFETKSLAKLLLCCIYM